MQVLKQSTVTTILVGPVLDSAGAAVTTAVLADFNLTKNGTSATLTGATVSHSHNGHYTIALTTSNTDTLGRLTVTVNNAAMAMAPFRYTVLTAAAFDTLVTNGTLAGTTSGRTIAVDASGFLTVATNNDKTGYALTQAFPSNFSSLAITVGGAVTAGTVSDKTGYSLASGGLSAVTTWTVAITGNITGSLSGSVGSVTGGVTVTTNSDKTGYSLSQAFPTHFADMQIAANGHVSSVVESMANNSITASAIQGDAITAAKIAADAVAEIQSGLATSANQTLILDRCGYLMAQEIGACSDAGTSAETYAITVNSTTYTIDHTGLDATGNRGTATLTKT